MDISNEKIDKIIELTADIEDDGTVWGYDTDVGPLHFLRKEIREILREQDNVS